MNDILIGQTDYSKFVFIPDPASTDGSGKTGLVAANLTVSYSRMETDNDATVTDVTSSLNDLAALTTAHTDWGVKEVSSTLAPGLYRLDFADAVFASGAWTAVVYVMITSSAAAASPIEFTLVAVNKLDGVRYGLTALPNAAADAAGGLPISDAGGLDLDAERADVAAILVDTGTTLDGRLPAALVSGRIDASVGAMAANVLTATAIASDAITDAKVASDVTIASVTGAVGSVTGAVGSVTGAVGSVAAGGITAASFAANAITAAKLDPDVTTELQAGLATAAALTTVEGKIDTIGGIVDAILVDTAEIGAAGAGLTVLATQASVNTIDDFLDTEIAAIKAKTDNLPSDPADASDIAGAFTTVNTKLDTIDDFLDTEVAAIKAKTDNLPSDPADASDIASSFATVNTKLDTIDDFLDTEVAAIKAKTDNLPSDPADASDIAGAFSTVNSMLGTIASYIDTEIGSITSAIATAQADLDIITGANGVVIASGTQTFNMTGSITGSLSGSVGSVSGAVGSVTGNVGGNVTGSIGSLATQAKADVNAEVVDVLATDTYAEPGQLSPAATASLAYKVNFIYKAWRNKTRQTGLLYELYGDDESTVDQKASVSDDGSAFTRAEVATGA